MLPRTHLVIPSGDGEQSCLRPRKQCNVRAKIDGALSGFPFKKQCKANVVDSALRPIGAPIARK